MAILTGIELSLQHMAFYAYRIAQRAEHTLGTFFEKLYDCSRERHLSPHEAQKFIQQTRQCIYPFSILTYENYKRTFPSLQLYEEATHIKRLRREVVPANSYVRIRNHFIRSGELTHPQTATELESALFWRRVNRQRRKSPQLGASLTMAADWMNEGHSQDDGEIPGGLDEKDGDAARLAYDEQEWDDLEVVDHNLPRIIELIADFDEVYEKEARKEYQGTHHYTMTFNEKSNNYSQ